MLIANNCNTNKDSYSNLPHSYDGPSASYETLFGDYNFSITDYEVYSVASCSGLNTNPNYNSSSNSLSNASNSINNSNGSTQGLNSSNSMINNNNNSVGNTNVGLAKAKYERY